MSQTPHIKQVFISHASGDKAVADALCAVLEAAGITCWIAPRDVPGGSYWAAEIVKVIPSTSVLLLLISARANSSTNVQSELMLAHKHRRAILPVRLEDTQLDGSLEYAVNTLQRLDIFPDHQQNLARVSAAIQIILTKSPSGAAPLPPPISKSARRPMWGPLLKGLLLLLLGALGGIAALRLAPVPQPVSITSAESSPALTSAAPVAPAAPAVPPVATSSISTVQAPTAAAPAPIVASQPPMAATPISPAPVSAPPAHPVAGSTVAAAPPSPASAAPAAPAPPAPAAPSANTLPEKKFPVIPPYIDKDKDITYTLKTWERQGTHVTFWLTVTSPHRDQFIQLGLNSVMLAPGDETWQNPMVVKDGQEQMFDYTMVPLLQGIPVRLGVRFRGIPPEIKTIKTLRLNLSSSTSLTPIIFSDLPLD